MKTKFATYDLCAILHDISLLKGMRVNNVYDINSKTYLLKLQKPGEKAFILFESGIRIHITTYDWPKATIPSGFSMKFRKHIKSKRLTAVSQVGIDRIVDLQFGDDERSCHVIVELYDRGNVVLTDHNYIILNILRPRTDHDTDVRFSVRERYPLEQARQADDFYPTPANILLFLNSSKSGDILKKSLVRHVPFGSLLLDHAFTKLGIPTGAQIGIHVPVNDAGAELVSRALEETKHISGEIAEKSHGGFIAYEEISTADVKTVEGQTIKKFQEYYPYDFMQFRLASGKYNVLEFPTFSEAVDKYYSSIETQKVEQRVLTTGKEADKKLQNIKKDHEKRIQALTEVKEIQERRAEYVLYNKELVEQALSVVKAALSNFKNTNKILAAKHRGTKLPPKAEIGIWLEKQAEMGDQPAARAITRLKLETNQFTMQLTNPYEVSEPPLNVDLDIGLNADQNSRRLFTNKRTAEAKKEKTAAATNKALKSALKSAKQQATNKINQIKIRQMSAIHTRKTYWFEKFLWFISTDGYLILAGKDAQQNEHLVKRYMRPGDIYVHAEIQGASSVVIRNKSAQSLSELPPPKTLNEAATFAVCFSTAWEANVSITAWWVKHDQVSRTAPTGEYLVAGSFMIRGKRNFLPSCPLQLGFGLMFKLDDESVIRHRQMRHDSEQAETENEEPINENELESENEEIQQSEEQEETDGEEEEFPDIEVRVAGTTVDDKETETNITNTSTNEHNEEKKDDIDEDEEEENQEEIGQEEALIETISAQPLEEDQLLFALPVCAPYTAMQKFKFKVKIIPGTCKRGKAVKMALELFNRKKSLSLMERTLLKSLIGDDRLLQCLPGKVRVSAPMLDLKHK